jgi:hypothetical protein
MKADWPTWAFWLGMKQGSSTHSPPARGSLAESGRPAASGWVRRRQGASHGGEGPDLGIGSGGAHRGGLAMVKQVGGGEPATAGQRRCGGRRLRVRGAVVSLGGGCCCDGGARRWSKVVLYGRATSENEGGGQLGASTVLCSGRWLRGRLGVAQRRTRVVHGGQRFGTWSRGKRREVERRGMELGGCCGKRRERASLSD